MSKNAWKLLLPAVVLALALPGSLAADEAALPEMVEALPDVVVDAEAPAPVEVPVSPDLQPAPVRMSDHCYSLSTCTPSFAACADWCYSQDCGVNYWDAGPQICYCGTKF